MVNMLTFLLIRHGIAEASRSDLPDSRRALTEEGRLKSRDAFKVLLDKGYVPSLGVSSPFLRAVETLDCLEEVMGRPLPRHVLESLQPGGDPLRVETWLRSMAAEEEDTDGVAPVVALVSHQPLCSRLIHQLTGAMQDMHKGSCAVLRFDQGSFSLDEVIHAEEED